MTESATVVCKNQTKRLIFEFLLSIFADSDIVKRLVFAGFDLCEVGQEEVVLKTGKQASRRNMHFALQALLALFGENDSLCFYFKLFGTFSHYTSLFIVFLFILRLHGAS